MDMRMMMKQAQKMQEKLQREIADLKVEGSAGGGMVKVEMAGNHQLLAVKIAPEVAGGGDVEMLEDLVRVAVNEAVRAIEASLADKMSGLRIPGF